MRKGKENKEGKEEKKKIARDIKKKKMYILF